MLVFCPFVYWAQTDSKIFLKIDLKDAQEPNLNVKTRKIIFNAKGIGAQGLKNYGFTLDLNNDVNSDDTVLKVTDNRVDLVLSKTTSCWWPRLIATPQKPAWLKIDFDRWQSEAGSDDEENVRDVREDYSDLYEKLQKTELGYKKEDFKKVYLTLYNLIMYVGFMYVVCVLLVRYVRDGADSFPGTYAAVGPAMCFLQMLQFLEVMHPMFGYVRGGMLMPLMQIGGRVFILFAMLEAEPRIQTMPVVFFLFLAWSSIEIIRYPFYMSQLLKKENGLLTWLRYTYWIVAYPVGFICEGVIVFRNLLFVEQSGKWTVSMPNALNFTFHFPTVLRIYLLFIMIPAMYTLMSHMYKARSIRIDKKRINFKNL